MIQAGEWTGSSSPDLPQGTLAGTAPFPLKAQLRLLLLGQALLMTIKVSQFRYCAEHSFE